LSHLVGQPADKGVSQRTAGYPHLAGMRIRVDQYLAAGYSDSS